MILVDGVQMKMATSMTTSIRYFNLANSYFEPLMDPWTFDIRVGFTARTRLTLLRLNELQSART